MPMLLAGRNPHHIAGSDFFNRSALGLDPAQARHDDQRLAERMRMPCRAGARLEGNAAAIQAYRFSHLKHRLRANRTAEIGLWRFGGRREPFRLISIVAFLRSVTSGIIGICARPGPEVVNNPMPVTPSRHLRVTTSSPDRPFGLSIAELRFVLGSTTVNTACPTLRAVQLFGLGAIIRMDLWLETINAAWQSG